MSARTPGRPRSSEADAAIMRATLELLAQTGYRGLSMEQVARRAGVGKTTIYRRHPSKHDLVAAAVRHLHAGLRAPEDTGSLRGDFRAVAAQATASAAVTRAPAFVPRLLAEASGDPDMLEIVNENLVMPRRVAVRTILERAMKRGEIRADVDVEIATDLLVGPVIYRLLIGGMDLPGLARHADGVLMAALDGLRRR